MAAPAWDPGSLLKASPVHPAHSPSRRPFTQAGSQSVSCPVGSTFQMTVGEAQLGQVTYIQNQHPCTWRASG